MAKQATQTCTFGKFEGDPMWDHVREMDIFMGEEMVGTIQAHFDVDYIGATSRQMAAKWSHYTVEIWDEDCKTVAENDFGGSWRSALKQAKQFARENASR